MLILFVDDDKASVSQRIEVLKVELNHDVVYVSSPEKALNIIVEKPFDLVFIDQNLASKKYSGLDLGEEISQIRELKHLPLVMLTAYDDSQLAVTAMSSRIFDYYISKKVFTGRNIERKMNEIEELKSVKDKQKLKESTKSEITNESHIEAILNEYLTDFDVAVEYYKANTIKNNLIKKLDAQETVFRLLKKKNAPIRPVHRWQKFHIYNDLSLGAAMYLIEEGKFDKFFSDNNAISVIDDLYHLKNHHKYGLKIRKNNNISKKYFEYFKPFVGGRIDNKRAICIALLRNEPNRWPLTIELVKERLLQEKMKPKKANTFFTFTDRIIMYMNEIGLNMKE